MKTLFLIVFVPFILLANGPEKYSLLLNLGYAGGLHQSSITEKEDEFIDANRFSPPFNYYSFGSMEYTSHSFAFSGEYFFSDWISLGVLYSHDYVLQKWKPPIFATTHKYDNIAGINRIGVCSSQWLLTKTVFRLTFTEQISFDFGSTTRFPIISDNNDSTSSTELGNFVSDVSEKRSLFGFGLGGDIRLFLFPLSRFGFFVGTKFSYDHLSIIDDDIRENPKTTIFSEEVIYPDSHNIVEFGFYGGISLEIAGF